MISTLGRLVCTLVRRGARRVERTDAGMELVQMAIALFIAAMMGAALLAAVQAAWPGIVQSVLQDVRNIFG